jgi:hypothetical protein
MGHAQIYPHYFVYSFCFNHYGMLASIQTLGQPT